jgi:hypothetical protein
MNEAIVIAHLSGIHLGSMTVLEGQSANPPHMSAAVHRDRSNERRDIQRAINLWQQSVGEDGGAPVLETFDFSPMRKDWGYRFLICSDQSAENAAFVVYGLKFAELLGLPERVITGIPVTHQLPERYRPVFTEGCSKAMTDPAPTRSSGSFNYDIKVELYRAVFLPIRLHPDWSKGLIFGSFNYRTVLSVDKIAP